MMRRRRADEGAGPQATISVVPATADRWADVGVLLGGDGDLGCWCQVWRGPTRGYGRQEPGARRLAMRAQLDEEIPPGLLAYLDGEVAGWCGFGPRARMQRLVRSRTIPTIDEVPVWSIVCFKVRVGYRRKGVARALLQGAMDYAREHGAPAMEAYPIDPEGKRLDVGFSYVGFVPMFEAAGFQQIVETDAKSAGRPRILMRRTLE